MNPFLAIINSLHNAAQQYASPQRMVQITKQPSQPQINNIARSLAQFGGVPAQNFAGPLTAQARAVLSHNNPVQQGQKFQQQNPFVKFLTARGVRAPGVGHVGMTSPQAAQTPAIQTPNVMNGGFNAQNINLPNPNPLPNNMAMGTLGQGKGDLIQ